MTGRYEIRDRQMPGRGMRFTAIDRARREIAQATVRPGRFYIYDRAERREVTS